MKTSVITTSVSNLLANISVSISAVAAGTDITITLGTAVTILSYEACIAVFQIGIREIDEWMRSAGAVIHGHDDNGALTKGIIV